MAAPLDSTRTAVERAVAAEVLELGQALFDAVIETAAAGRPPEAADEAYAEAEVRAAAEEFFTALRLLLGLEPGESATAPGEAAALPTPATRGEEDRA